MRKLADADKVFEREGVGSIEGPFFSQKDPNRALFVGGIGDAMAVAESPDIIPGIVQVYRDAFGHSLEVDPSSSAEYTLCTSCGAKQAIEAVYKQKSYEVLEVLERSGIPELGDCPECQEDTLELFHDPVMLQRYIKEKMQSKDFLGAIVFDQERKIHGFHYGWLDSLRHICQELLYFFKGIEQEEMLSKIKKNTNEFLTDDASVLYLPEVAIQKLARHPELFHAMFRASFSNKDSSFLSNPTISLSQKGLQGCKLLEAAGHEVIYQNPATAFIILSAKSSTMVRDVFTLSAEEFNRSYASHRRRD